MLQMWKMKAQMCPAGCWSHPRQRTKAPELFTHPVGVVLEGVQDKEGHCSQR